MKASLACILTSTTGKTFVRDFNEFKKFLSDFSGVEGLVTIQCGSVNKDVKLRLLEQLPFLNGVTVSHVTNGNVRDVLAQLESQYGKTHTVSPMK